MWEALFTLTVTRVPVQQALRVRWNPTISGRDIAQQLLTLPEVFPFSETLPKVGVFFCDPTKSGEYPIYFVYDLISYVVLFTSQKAASSNKSKAQRL